MYITWGQVKDAFARVSAGGICADDPRNMERANEAVQRLLPRGNWVGTVARYTFCVAKSCISLPAQFETLIGYRHCWGAGNIHPMSYKFTDNGPGLFNQFSSCSLQGSDLGFSPVFYDPCNLPQKLAIYHDVSEVAGSVLTVQGLDENGNIIRSVVGGEWINGFNVPLDGASPYFPPNLITKITGYVKPATNGVVRVYYVDPNTAAQTLSAIIEPDDMSPQFRRYHIPNNFRNPNPSAPPPIIHQIDALVKYAYRPITNDNDRLLIQSQGAMKKMLLALNYEEVDLEDKAEKAEAKAIAILNEELFGYMGSGMVHTARVQMKGSAPGLIQAPR